MEELKKEEAVKIEAKNAELSQKMDELMISEVKKMQEELNQYAAVLSDELSAKMTAYEKTNSPAQATPSELKALEEKIAAKKQEISAYYDHIRQDVNSKIAEVAVKHSLEAVLGSFIINNGALDITDLVIAEFKK